MPKRVSKHTSLSFAGSQLLKEQTRQNKRLKTLARRQDKQAVEQFAADARDKLLLLGKILFDEVNATVCMPDITPDQAALTLQNMQRLGLIFGAEDMGPLFDGVQPMPDEVIKFTFTGERNTPFRPYDNIGQNEPRNEKYRRWKLEELAYINFKCPECGKVKLKLGEWVVKRRKRRGLPPCCKHCWSENRRAMGGKGMGRPIKLLPPDDLTCTRCHKTRRPERRFWRLGKEPVICFKCAQDEDKQFRQEAMGTGS